MVSRDQYRSVGAISGLVIAFMLMFGLGYGGLVPAAMFGITGAVTGGMLGERWHDRNRMG